MTRVLGSETGHGDGQGGWRDAHLGMTEGRSGGKAKALRDHS